VRRRPSPTSFTFFLLRAVRPVLGRAPLLQGVGAGVGVQLFILPLDMAVTRLQSGEYAAQGADCLRVFAEIVKKQGFLGLWTGLQAGIFLTLNPGITNMVLARIQRGDGRGDSAARSFWAGAVAKAVASVCTYPYLLAKVQMQMLRPPQALSGGAQKAYAASKTPAVGMVQLMAAIVREGGPFALFEGLSLQLLNGVLKEALLNMIRLKISASVTVAFLLLGARIK